MKLKCLVIAIISFFVFSIRAYAILPLCEYILVTDTSSVSEWIEKQKQFQDGNNEYGLISIINTRPEFFVSKIDSSSLKFANGIVLSGFTYLNYRENILHGNGTYMKFDLDYNGAKVSTAASFGIVGDYNVYVNFHWMLDNYNPEKDPKKDFIEKGSCPQYIYYDGKTMAEGHFSQEDGININFTNDPYWAVMSQGDSGATSISSLLDGNNAMYKLRFSMIGHYFGSNIECYDEGCPSSDFNKEGIDAITKIASSNLDSLSSSEIDAATQYLSLSAVTSVASDVEKYKLAQLINANENDVYSRAAKVIVDEASKPEGRQNKVIRNNPKLVEAAKYFFSTLNGEKVMPSHSSTTCYSVLGDVNDEGSFAYYLQMILNFVQFLGPILVVVLTTVEYFKAIFSGDDGAVKKANTKTVKRLIAVALLFFVPILVKLLLNLFEITSNCGIS